MDTSVEVPEGATPAELSLLLVGRPSLGAVAGTLVDLVERGVLGEDLRPVGDTAVAHERPLLAVVDDLERALAGFRHELAAAGVHRGWFHHVRHTRTRAGERALADARAFRAALRRAHRADLLGHAVALGLVDREATASTRAVSPVVARASELPEWQPPAREPARFGPGQPDSPNDLTMAVQLGWLATGPF